jgi:stress response protein YsnF/sporulation protein YlmC with PRC-barrel domain
MTDQMYSNRIEAVKNTARIHTLVEKLRQKLRGFAVLDGGGMYVGDVKDLMLDENRQLGFIVSQSSIDRSPRLYLLMSRLIQKIDPPTKSAVVGISKVEIESLPEYAMTQSRNMELPTGLADTVRQTADTSKDSATQPVSNIVEPKTVVPEHSSKTAETQGKMNEYTETEAPSPTSEVLEEEIVRLLEERLVVDRSKHKVGEIVIRKEIETRMVQVPIRREKLIVEQVGPERKHLAEIDLGGEEVSGIEFSEAVDITASKQSDSELTVGGTLTSPKVASLLLNAIALERHHGCKQVRVEIVVEDASRQKIYQEWFDRCSRQRQ